MTSFYKEIHASNSMSDERENIESRKNVDKWIFRLLLLVIGVMPLIVFAHIENIISPLVSNVGVLISGTKGELFTHFKALFILVITIISSVLLLTKIFFMGGTIRKTVLNYPLAILTIMIVVSTIASPNITIALGGLYNRSDGAISWLCYIVLMFIAMNINYPKNAIKYILYTTIPFVVINLFIITMNFYGKDLLQYKWVQSIVTLTLPEGGTLGEGSQLVGTLNQWNYMSGMFAIMAMMFLTGAILEEKLSQAIGYLVIAIMSMSIMLMSMSTSGFLTVCIMLFFVLLAIIKSKVKKRSLVMIIVFFLAVIPIFHILASKNPQVWTESIGFAIKSNPYMSMEEITQATSNKGSMEFSLMNKAYAAGKFELPALPPRLHGAGSGRIYIWEKAFELFKQRPIVGYGMDTFMYNFPHYNIDARLSMWDENIIVDKPHSMYIGWLYGTGVIGFLSVMVLIILSASLSLTKAIKQSQPTIWILGIAWGAYLIQGLFNDSLPGVSAVMWVLAGIMLAFIINNKEQVDGRNN